MEFIRQNFLGYIALGVFPARDDSMASQWMPVGPGLNSRGGDLEAGEARNECQGGDLEAGEARNEFPACY